MEILIPNHKKRDESLKYQKENARRILKEKQKITETEAKKTRDLRRTGKMMDEELKEEQECRRLSELHLIE